MSAGLIIVAAGSSARMDGTDKVWTLIGDRPTLDYSLRALTPLVTHAVLVVREQCLEPARRLASDSPNIEVVAGGTERYESVARGLEALGAVDYVAVHDAARPFAPARLLHEGLSLVCNHAGAVPVIPLADTLKRVSSDGVVESTVNRTELRAAQTPQIFNAKILRSVYANRSSTEVPTDDSYMVERQGHTVCTFAGAAEAFKITTEHDLRVARLLFTAGLVP